MRVNNNKKNIVKNLLGNLQNYDLSFFDLSKSLESKTANDAIFNYVNEHLLILQQDKKMPLQFVGFELEGDVTWVYIEAPMNSSKIKTLTITNTLLCDLTQEQTNLMQINWNGKDFSEKLNCSNNRFELKATK